MHNVARLAGDMNPKFSVVIPCHNYGRYLRGCVDSVLMQGVSVEILIIDDASTDESWIEAQRLAEQHSAVSARRHLINAGHIATYNEGLLEWSRGDYLVLLSADDLLAPEALHRASYVLDLHPRVGLVYGVQIPFESSDDIDFDSGVALPPVPRYRLWDGPEWIRKRFRQGVNVVGTPTAIVRASVHRRVGGYTAELPHAADFELWLRIGLVSDLVYIRGVAQAYYRVHPKSMSQALYVDPFADARERRKVFDRMFAHHGPELSCLGISRSGTYRSLASEPLWHACRLVEKGASKPEELNRALTLSESFYPQLTDLPAYRALKRRLMLGEVLCHRSQIFVGTAVVRKVRNLWWWKQWRLLGG